MNIFIEEDLEFFFEHAMSDARRRKFWLRYLRSINRTTCVLDPQTRTRPTKKFAGANEKLGAAIARARSFKGSETTGAQAFCLYFKDIVVVEFSTSGNAAYIYHRAHFQRVYETGVQNNAFQNAAKLKESGLANRRRIVHTTNWETDAALTLSNLGIYPDRGKAA